MELSQSDWIQFGILIATVIGLIIEIWANIKM